jgi:hypothetical protein
MKHALVINNPQSAPAALATPRVCPAELPEAAGSRHQIAVLGMVGKPSLQFAVSILVQIAADMPGKGRGFNEFHSCLLYANSVELPNRKLARSISCYLLLTRLLPLLPCALRTLGAMAVNSTANPPRGLFSCIIKAPGAQAPGLRYCSLKTENDDEGLNADRGEGCNR